ncbi:MULTISPECIES: TetR/AcrR family transcriptional regulator [Amycolatopsis]|uniref:TetR/AcrR family transcriptional regulator n=1 Tax=Amycolatopsis TaxID=1813 RepID=UPI0014310D5A|nr:MULTISPECIES: TetR/AcrR family transcriptional regulator [Amycolatopsis]MCG3755771.1 TetR/AcrR family transcriptional regulator [Amycolatopsis sp. Poz14]
MARSTPGVTRQHLVEAATRLFAERGFDKTSTADVQRACGLNPGSGALYKHFPSKRALLEEIVQQHLAGISDRSRQAIALPEAPEKALPVIARLVWDSMRQDRAALRIMFRELEPFPDLREQMWHGVLGSVYTAATEWIASGVRRGDFQVEDPEATASVLLAALTYYPILDALVGHTPGDVGEEAFLAAWTAQARLSLGLKDG